MPKLIIAISIITALFAIWTIGSIFLIRTIEEPSYVLIEKRGDYEIRKYSKQIIAEVNISGNSYSEALNKGFSILADYIFGNNKSSEVIAMTKPVQVTEAGSKQGEKIAMTKPVITSEAEEGVYNINFIMPSSYALENLPKPNNSKIIIKEIAPHKVAVLKFNGWYATKQRIEKAKMRLISLLEKDNLNILANPKVAQYNPPLTMPFILHNEILIDIE